MIKLIWAQDENGGIGKDGKLPWHIPEELRQFKSMTYGHDIIMGRKTFDSLPGVLPGRASHVVTSTPETLPSGVIGHTSIDSALEATTDPWVIGGANIIAQVIDRADVIRRTIVAGDYGCDTVCPPIPGDFEHRNTYGFTSKATGIGFTVEHWVRKES